METKAQQEAAARARSGRSDRGAAAGRLTVDLLARPPSVLGHVDPDPSSDGAHLLASVAQEGLKLLRGAGQRAQSHAALTCKQQFTDYYLDEFRRLVPNKS